MIFYPQSDLSKNCPIGTDEGCSELLLRAEADMEHLASEVHISVVSPGHQTLTREGSVYVRPGQEGVVNTWLPGDSVTKPLERITIIVTILVTVPGMWEEENTCINKCQVDKLSMELQDYQWMNTTRDHSLSAG